MVELAASLARKGFEAADASGSTRRLVRRQADRHDHVAIILAGPGWVGRLLRRPQALEEVVVGVVWPIGEMAFSRPVPPMPVLPQQAHAATSFARLLGREPTDVATLAAAVDDWCRRMEDPTTALATGAIAEPVRRLEFAVITSQRGLGLEAAEAARVEARELPPQPRRQAMKRIDLAEARLPKA